MQVYCIETHLVGRKFQEQNGYKDDIVYPRTALKWIFII